MVTPILQWDQYELWYQKAAGMSNPVKDRSFDHTSDLAQVCLGPPKGWRVPDPDHAGCELIYKHVICYSLWVHALEKPVIITCSGGGHKSGKRFGELIFNRGDRYPITAGVYKMYKTTKTSQTSGDDYQALAFDNAGWNDQETNDKLFKEFVRLRDALKDNLLFGDSGEEKEEDEETEAKF